MKIEVDVIIEEVETEILTTEILEEETSETETPIAGTLEEETSETEIQEITDLMAEKRKFLLIMTGLAQSVTIRTFHLEKNVIVAESQKVVILVEEIIEAVATEDQEIIGQIGMMASLENLGRQKENLQIMPTIEGQNRSMSVLEEEIAMIK